MKRLADAEREGSAAAEKMSAASLGELRALPARQVLESFPVPQPVIDGNCIPEDPWRRVAAGRAHDGELLVGSNADEGTFPYLRARELGVGFTSAADYSDYVRERFGTGADAFLRMYPAESQAEFNQAQLDAFRDEVAWSSRFSALTHARNSSRKSSSTISHIVPRRLRPVLIAGRPTERKFPLQPIHRVRTGEI
jgi:para-nitrobenzyl esterase